LFQRGIFQGATILDAGCGTGRYAIELAHRGYRVHGIDRSPGLLAEAKKSLEGRSVPVAFRDGDITSLSASLKYDVVLCRGVLYLHLLILNLRFALPQIFHHCISLKNIGRAPWVLAPSSPPPPIFCFQQRRSVLINIWATVSERSFFKRELRGPRSRSPCKFFSLLNAPIALQTGSVIVNENQSAPFPTVMS
jgi:SAM-dependent methyltransferase